PRNLPSFPTRRSSDLIPKLDTLQLAWFDHWLKGVGNGIESFPDETWFQGANRWLAGSYPQGSTPRALYLGGSPSGSGAGSLYDGDRKSTRLNSSHVKI